MKECFEIKENCKFPNRLIYLMLKAVLLLEHPQLDQDLVILIHHFQPLWDFILDFLSNTQTLLQLFLIFNKSSKIYKETIITSKIRKTFKILRKFEKFQFCIYL